MGAKEAQKKYNRTVKGQYSELKHAAKARKIKMNITFEQYELLRRYPCAYCGGALPEAGHGLDRLDPDGPYSKDNVVACCWSCNRARGDNVDRLEVMLFGAIKRALKAYSEFNKSTSRK